MMDRSLFIVIAIFTAVIVADEFAYHYIKAARPGHMFSNVDKPRPMAIHSGMSNYSDYVKGPPLPEPYPYRVRGIRHYAAW